MSSVMEFPWRLVMSQYNVTIISLSSCRQANGKRVLEVKGASLAKSIKYFQPKDFSLLINYKLWKFSVDSYVSMTVCAHPGKYSNIL